MNYEITGSYLSKHESDKNLKPFLLLILSIVFIPAAYAFVAAVFIAQLIKGNLNIKVNKSSVLVYAYVAIGLTASDYKLISAAYGLLIMLCFYSFRFFKTSSELKDFKKTKKLIFIVSLFVFAAGILQYFSPDFSIASKWVDTSEYNLNKRIYSTFFNPNVFGFYINFVILLSCENLDFKKINLEWIAFMTGISCLVLTFSRAAWISLIAALITSSFLDRKYIKYALIVSIAIFGADTLLGVGRVNPVKAANDSSLLYRLEIWKASVEIIKDNFISGIGFGTLFKHIASYSSVVSTKIEHSHNLYLQILTETGILGFSIFSTMIFNALKKLHSKLTEENNGIWITAFAVFVMTMAHGLVDSVPITPQIMMILSIYAGTLTASTDSKI